MLAATMILLPNCLYAFRPLYYCGHRLIVRQAVALPSPAVSCASQLSFVRALLLKWCCRGTTGIPTGGSS